MLPNFNDYDAILLDLDGTVYHEDHALPGAIPLIHRFQSENRKFACLTNSTSSPERIAARLRRMGVDLPADAIYTAGAAAADYVIAHGADAPPSAAPAQLEYRAAEDDRPRVFSLATEGVNDLLAGKVYWVRNPDDRCDIVLVGTPTSELATEDRQRVALEILRRQRTTRLIGICADRVYPSPRGIEFGSGALTAMLAYAANVTPIFTGKPEPIFFQELCQRLNVSPDRCLLIGDNLESDIAGAKNVGMKTILTLTGVTHRHDLKHLPPLKQPDAVIDDLTQLP